MAVDRVESLILEAERAKKGEAAENVEDAINRVERALKIAGALDACVDEYLEKMERTVRDFLDKLEGLARDMKEASE